MLAKAKFVIPKLMSSPLSGNVGVGKVDDTEVDGEPAKPKCW